MSPVTSVLGGSSEESHADDSCFEPEKGVEDVCFDSEGDSTEFSNKVSGKE